MSTSLHIEMQAVDTLFFRDAKPFTMGDETGASGMFPPSPSVLYGALRSVYFASHPEQFNLAGKQGDPTSDLRITGVALLREQETYLPLPRDLIKRKIPLREEEQKEEKEQSYAVYKTRYETKTVSGIINNLPGEGLLRVPFKEVAENLDGGMIEVDQLEDYLNAVEEHYFVRRLDDWVSPESKIGIARDDVKRSSEEQALYRLNMSRPNVIVPQHNKNPNFTSRDLRFIIRFTGLPDFPKEGIMRLGGEGKAVTFRQIEAKLDIPAPQIQPQKGFKLYLATSTVFANGWLPSWLSEETLKGTYQGLNLKLLAAAVGRFQPIGGFDMVKRMPKPLQRMVPAGSVYYFRLDSGTPEDVLKVFHQRPISDFEEYCRQGFGISYIAKESA